MRAALSPAPRAPERDRRPPASPPGLNPAGLTCRQQCQSRDRRRRCHSEHGSRRRLEDGPRHHDRSALPHAGSRRKRMGSASGPTMPERSGRSSAPGELEAREPPGQDRNIKSLISKLRYFQYGFRSRIRITKSARFFTKRKFRTGDTKWRKVQYMWTNCAQ